MFRHEKRSIVPGARSQSLRPLLTELVAKGFFHGFSHAGRLHPLARPEAHNVELIRDVPYAASAHKDHRLDIYRPQAAAGPLPVVLYMHGGGFHILSKDTHWLMGLMFARAGYVVFNISYRLAPRHPFPAALQDASDALCWLARHAGEYGGDTSQLIFAGESAGANLASALAVASCYRRPELYAQRVFDTGLLPRAVVSACGILQVSDPGRFARRRKLPWWVNGMLTDISAGYVSALQADAELADPLVVLERGQEPDRPLPAFFAFAGTRDPILDDTRRLAAALTRLNVAHEAVYYPGEMHAFHALMFRKAAQQCWRDTLTFLERSLADAQRRSELACHGRQAS